MPGHICDIRGVHTSTMAAGLAPIFARLAAGSVLLVTADIAITALRVCMFDRTHAFYQQSPRAVPKAKQQLERYHVWQMAGGLIA